MYTYLGDFPAGATIFFPFQTFNSSGASVTITGLAVTDIEVYKGASITQRASDAGYALVDTDGIDLDGITGIHGFTIDTSDNTDAGFYAAGNDYTVVVSSITADSQTVNFIAGRFSIDNRGLLRPTTAQRTLDVTAAGEAGLDFANVAIPDGPVPALGVIEGGTAQSATSTTLVGRAAATNDIVRPGHYLWAFGSTQGYWQAVMIDSVSGDTFTIAAWPVTTPTGTITYRVYGVPAQSSALPVPADAVKLGGDEQSLTDLKDFADAGYDPSTNKVQGVVLTDTVTTYTGNTPQTGDSFARIGATGSGLTTLATAAAVASILSTQYQKNVAAANIPVYMVTSADPTAPATGLTLTVTRSIDGGAFGSATGTAAEISAGLYQFDASQADMNGDDIVFKFVGTGAVTRILHISTYT